MALKQNCPMVSSVRIGHLPFTKKKPSLLKETRTSLTIILTKDNCKINGTEIVGNFGNFGLSFKPFHLFCKFSRRPSITNYFLTRKQEKIRENCSLVLV